MYELIIHTITQSANQTVAVQQQSDVVFNTHSFSLHHNITSWYLSFSGFAESLKQS